MTLTAEQVASAGRAAVSLLGLDATAKPRDFQAWPDTVAEAVYATVEFYSDEDFETDAVGFTIDLLDQLTNDISETDEHWGVAFPPCPRHAHPASYLAVGRDVVTRCPASGAEIARVTP